MLRVGITGGIGSGKTTACKLFEKLGVPVYYADNRAKELMVDDKQLRHSIIQNFGAESYLEDGSLNRLYLSSVVFSEEKKLELLNSLVHPVVAADSESWNSILERKNFAYSLREAALLIETGSYKLLDKLIVVTAPEEDRIKRVMLRDGSSEQQVKSRINAQMPDSEKLKLADFIIENTDLISLAQQVKDIHERIMKLL
ncbi:MAG: dephospho-CoA kinase [Chitinophagales bacterium]|nr:dephospho-CoA kinase [Chitinophagales bacterium]MCO5280509.1 dephospho-CoA kinase [Chitinophagales bacterium]OJV26786.1 MAG: dephospho-CoA kinase [Bacteroidetes bacterium 37-13]HRP40094.1 dephospho-CoA kinase [Chitinophagales bacterium]